MTIVDRSAALVEIFEQSRGKRSFTIKTLTDTAVQQYPHLFSPRPNPSTITRAVKQLMRRCPIRQDTAANAPAPIVGDARQSPRQLVWTYVPGMGVLQSLEKLSDVPKKISAMISMAVAIEATMPVAGMRFHDDLVQLMDLITRDETLSRHAEQVKNTIAKYRVGTTARKKKRGTLAAKVDADRKRDILRTLDQCVAQNHRLRIRHRHEFGQKNEEAYVLEPHALTERNGSVFVIAHTVTDPPALKQFKLDRITKAEDLRQPNEFEYDTEGNLTGRRWPRDLVTRPLFPLDKILDGTIHNYLPPPDAPQARDIEIVVDKRVAKWVEEEMIHPQQRTAAITLADGSKTLKVQIDKAYINELVPRILGLGEFVKVIKPSNLVDAVYQRLSTAAGQYEGADSKLEEGGKPPAPTRRSRHARSK